MYQFAYSAICEELPAADAAPSLAQKLPIAIELIEAAGKARPASREELLLLSDFRKLWLSIAKDLMRAGPELPQETEADWLTAATGVLEAIERRRFERRTIQRKRSSAAPEALL